MLGIGPGQKASSVSIHQWVAGTLLERWSRKFRSIFLRVDESRVDVIKALIIGPEGTP